MLWTRLNVEERLILLANQQDNLIYVNFNLWGNLSLEA